MDIRKLTAAALAMSVFIASCDEKEEKTNAKKIYKLAEDTISDDFSGIVGSSVKYSCGENSGKYRRKLTEKLNTDEEWLIVAENGNLTVYTAEDWESEDTKCYPKDNSINSSLKKHYNDIEKNYIDEKENSDILMGSMIDYVDKSKQLRQNTIAKCIFNALNCVIVELDCVGKDISDIKVIISIQGKTICYENDMSIYEFSEDIGIQTKVFYTDFLLEPYVIAFVDKGVVKSVYLADDADSKISGSYPIRNENITVEDVCIENDVDYNLIKQ